MTRQLCQPWQFVVLSWCALVVLAAAPVWCRAQTETDAALVAVQAASADEASAGEAAATDDAAAPARADAEALPAAEPVEPPPLAVAWHKPVALLAELEELQRHPPAAAWAGDVRRLLGQLADAWKDVPSALKTLDQLDQLAQQGQHGAAELPLELARKVRRACYAVGRRTSVWRDVATARQPADAAPPRGEHPERILVCLAELDRIMPDAATRSSWWRYLGLEALRQAVSQGTMGGEDGRRIAQRLLLKLSPDRLSQEQAAFVAAGPIARLAAELRGWAVEPRVDLGELLAHVEQYEQCGTAAAARLLADDCYRLAFTPHRDLQRLAADLETHYRNANLRMVVGRELLARLVPARPVQYAEINDVVMGAWVHGHSAISSQVDLRLVPDPQRLRLALEVNGMVSSLTHSTSGPATFYNDSNSAYRAWKEVELRAEGIRVYPTQVAVNNNIQLRGLETDFDRIPLANLLARQVAGSQYKQRREEMDADLEEKISARAREQIDRETDGRLAAMSGRLRTAILDPLARMDLGPAIVAAETSQQRMTMRARLASDVQLGAHTPRPQAPSDSLASLQIHQSALNNLLDGLELDGRTFTLAELRRRIAERFNRPALAQRSNENDDLKVTFAPRGAARVECEAGRVALVLSIARLSKPPRTWDNFQVRIQYRLQARGRGVELLRDDVIQLIGIRLPMRSQVTLRGVFSTAFPPERPLQLMSEAITREPRLAGLVVTQTVVEDGWIGLAMGHEPPRPRVARRGGRE